MIYLSYDYNYDNNNVPVWIYPAVKYGKDHNIPVYVSGSIQIPEGMYKKNIDKYKSKLTELGLDKFLLYNVKGDVLEEEDEGKFFLQKQVRAQQIPTSIDSVFFDLYAMLRADLIICNVGLKSNIHDWVMAKHFNKKVIGITNHFVVDPYFLYHVGEMVSYNNTDTITQLLEITFNGTNN